MQNSNTENIVVLILSCTAFILLLVAFVTVIVFKYQKRQHLYFENIEQLKAIYQTTLLESQLEIQEQTFQNISREIHDNIGQKLTLAKLQLNTLDNKILNGHKHKIDNAIDMIGEAISDLSDISRSMSSEQILQNGLIKALEFEAAQIAKLGLYSIKLVVSTNTLFLDTRSELVLFRIVQEALNNIIKHAAATQITISLNFTTDELILQVTDNGCGIRKGMATEAGIGLGNMQKRAAMLHGSCMVKSEEGDGTTIQIQIPLHEHTQTY